MNAVSDQLVRPNGKFATKPFGKPANADATLGYLRDAYRGALRARAV